MSKRKRTEECVPAAVLRKGQWERVFVLSDETLMTRAKRHPDILDGLGAGRSQIFRQVPPRQFCRSQRQQPAPQKSQLDCLPDALLQTIMQYLDTWDLFQLQQANGYTSKWHKSQVCSECQELFPLTALKVTACSPLCYKASVIRQYPEHYYTRGMVLSKEQSRGDFQAKRLYVPGFEFRVWGVSRLFTEVSVPRGGHEIRL
jgi:hypothetical protein